MTDKLVMERRAADNAYLHPDFHGALSVGLEYIQTHYGDDAVRDYLRQFARQFYAPLTAALRERGLIAMREHLEQLYAVEGGHVELTMTEDELTMTVDQCPAVQHMRARELPVSPLWHETTRTVYETICEDTSTTFEMIDYEPQTGACRARFSRRAA